MEECNRRVLETILIKKANEYQMAGMKHTNQGNVISMYSNLEDYHLFHTIVSELDVWNLNLQYSFILEEKQLRVLIFVDPVMLSGNKKEEACILINEINRRMKALGKFCVDLETGDFFYDISIPYNMLATMSDFIEHTIFDSVLSFYETLHVPFVMFAKGMWEIDLAVDYLTTLMDNGWIDNLPYGLV